MKEISLTPSESDNGVAHSGYFSNHTTPEIREAIMHYTPQRASRAKWVAVRGFVRACVTDSIPMSPTVAGVLMSVLTHFVLWAVYEMHMPLDRHDLFYPVIIRRYVNELTTSTSSRQSRESYLFRIGRAISEDIPPARHATQRRSADFKPYTRRQLAEIVAWGQNRKRPEKRREAIAVIGLAGGAGVRHSELSTVKRSDVTRSADGEVSVRIGGKRPRTVLVSPEWRWHFDDILGNPVTDFPAAFLRPLKPPGIKKSVSVLFSGPHPVPELARLRDTWALEVFATTPFAEAIYSLGVSSTTALNRYLPHLLNTISKDPR